MTQITTKNSSTGAAVPVTGDLVQGELAVNVADKKLYTKDAGGAIVELGINPTTIDINAGTIDGTTIGATTPSTGVFTNVTGTLLTAAQPNITSLGTITSLVATTADINAGTIDGTVIGGSTAAAATVTTFTSTGIDDNATSTAITIDASENVGIGTSSPSEVLHIGGASTTKLQISSTSATGISGIHFGDPADVNSGRVQYEHTTDHMGLFTNNAERMRIDSSGNVGIGTSSPARTLEITAAGTVAQRWSNTSANNYVEMGTTGGSVRFGTNSGAFNLLTGGDAAYAGEATALTVDASGNVGIGTSSPARALHVNSASGIVGTIEGTGVRSFLSFNNSSLANDSTIKLGADGNNLTFYSNSAERMRIDSIGNLLVGTADTTLFAATSGGGVLLDPNGPTTIARSNGVSLYLNRTTSDGIIQELRKDGTTVGSISVTASSTSYNTSSDYRLKEDDVPMTGATERVKALRPVNFAWKVDGARVDGFFAHELAEVVPEATTGAKDAMRDEEYEVTAAIEEVRDEDDNITTEAVEAVMGTRSVPDMQSIDQSKLVPLLTATIQELIARIEALEV